MTTEERLDRLEAAVSCLLDEVGLEEVIMEEEPPKVSKQTLLKLVKEERVK